MTDSETHQAILIANAAFYMALAEADLTAMEDLWQHSAEVECIHPGWDRLRGWPAVRESWAAIFKNQGPFPVKPSEAVVYRRGDLAWVSCYENITSQAEALEISQTVATNLFEQVAGRWQMIAHHASPAPPSITRSRSWTGSIN